MGKNDFCCAHGCSNNRKRNPDLQFYRIPKDSCRRKAWLARIRRENFSPSDNTRICSAHFVGGVKSDDPQAEGFTPSLFNHSHSAGTTQRTTSNSLKCNDINIDTQPKPKRRRLSKQLQVLESKGRPKQDEPTIAEHKVWGTCLPSSHCLKEHDYCKSQVDPQSLAVNKSIVEEMQGLYQRVADLEAMAIALQFS